MLLQVRKFEDSAKTTPSILLSSGSVFRAFFFLFDVYDVSLNVTLPRVRTGLEKDKRNYHNLP